jgi:hypothetical protein
MWDETEEGRNYVEAVSRLVVAEIDADELEFFDELVEEYYEDPHPPKAADAAMGSGFGETLVAITPAAMAMATAVLSHVLTELTGVLKEETTEALKAALQRLFRPEEEGKTPESGDDEGPAPFTKEQLEEIRRIARREARRFGVDSTTATNMAYAVVGALAVA